MKLKAISVVGFLTIIFFLFGAGIKNDEVKEEVIEEPVQQTLIVEDEEMVMVLEEPVEKGPYRVGLDTVALSGEEQLLIQDLAEEIGIDYRFAYALMWTESRFEWVMGDSNLNHPAIGYFQISTINEERMLSEYGLDIYDPMQNIEAGMRIIQELAEEFKDGYNGYDTETCIVMCYKCGLSRGKELMADGFTLDVVDTITEMKTEFEL